MRPVEVLDRDICEGHTDLTVVPCSGKMKKVEKSRNQARIEHYGLPSPHDLKDQFGYGQISPIFPPKRNGEKITFFTFASSVLNRSDPGKIESIGRGGSVDLYRFRAFSKWFSASVTPPPLRASAG
jgi:hypothetical protein